MDLLQHLLETFFGTLFGAVTAFGSERWKRAREARAKEHAALNGLIIDLHLKRAFAITEPRRVDPVSCGQDIQFATQSVFNARDLIREARLQLRPGSPAFATLVKMAAACNLYIEVTEQDRAQYQFSLAELRNTLMRHIESLQTEKGIDGHLPGHGAFQSN